MEDEKIKCRIINPPQNIEDEISLKLTFAKAYANIIIDRLEKLPLEIRKNEFERIIKACDNKFTIK